MSATTSAAPASPGTNILQPFTQPQLVASAGAGAAIRSVGTRFCQQIYSATITPTYGVPSTITVPIQNVGLVTKFFALITTTVTNPGGGTTLTRTGFGPFNSLSQIIYTDPNTNQRINTTGWHLASVTARRHRRVPGAALTTDSPTGFGSVVQPIGAPASIAAGTTGTVAALYEIPLAFGRNSFQGAVFAGAVFATQSLQLVFNPAFAQNSADGANAVYTGASNAAPPTYSTSVVIFQEYWDQFPYSLLTPLAPDLSTTYELKNTALTSLIANMDNYVRFTNLRQFLSVTAYFDNGGTLNSGGDINYFLLQSANQTQIWKRPPALHSYLTRNMFGDDFPPACYMFDFSDSPIVTAAEGNTVLGINPSTVNANAVINVGWEDLATSSILASAPALAGSAGG